MLPRPAVRADGEPAHRRRHDAQGVRHLLIGELQEARNGDGTAKGHELRGVQTAAAAAPRVADASRRPRSRSPWRRADPFPVAPVRSAMASPGGRERGAVVRGVADVAVVGRPAASLRPALTRARWRREAWRRRTTRWPSGRPPRSFARSRRMRAESIRDARRGARACWRGSSSRARPRELEDPRNAWRSPLAPVRACMIHHRSAGSGGGALGAQTPDVEQHRLASAPTMVMASRRQTTPGERVHLRGVKRVALVGPAAHSSAKHRATRCQAVPAMPP